MILIQQLDKMYSKCIMTMHSFYHCRAINMDSVNTLRYGMYRYYSGDVYEGGFLNSLRSGHGMYRCADGDVYEGQWLNDKQSRHGVLRGADGTIIHPHVHVRKNKMLSWFSNEPTAIYTYLGIYELLLQYLKS